MKINIFLLRPVSKNAGSVKHVAHDKLYYAKNVRHRYPPKWEKGVIKAAMDERMPVPVPTTAV